jgi:PAS domain S-box-containing protein
LALKIALGYALLGALWIFCSGWLLHFLVKDAAIAAHLENVKGWFFIGVTALLLGLALDRYFRRIQQAAQQLGESETRLHLLGDNLPDSYVYQYVQEPDGTPRFTYVSAGVERVHGVTAAEILEDPNRLLGQIDPDQLALRAAAEMESSRSLTDFEMELKVRRSDGETRIIHLRSKPTLTPEGKVLWDGFGEDITGRKQAEEALNAGRSQLSTALEMAHLGPWEYDVAADLFTFNDHFYKIFRATAEQVGGYKMSSAEYARRFLHPDDADMVREETEKAIETTDPHFNRQVEHRILYADGTMGYIAVRIFVAKDDQGRTVRTYGVNQDITDRRRVEEELRKSEERFRLAYATSPDAININRMSDGLYVDINDGFTQLTGFTREDVSGKTSLDINIWCNPADRRELIDRLQKTGACENLEAQFRRKDGSVTTALMSARIIHLQDVPHILSITRDISERKRADKEKAKLQDQLLQSQKMESIGRLAGGVAHDFNNMLGVILGHVEMAMEGADPARPLYGNLEEIRKAAHRSTELTRQLLAFARKQTVSPRVLDLNETIEAALRMLRRLIGEDIQLAWLPGKGAWPVRVDPTQIDQILANLSVNSRDAIAGVGHLTIETRNIHCDEAYCAGHPGLVPGDYVLLAVSDDGCGMDHEIQSKLFEPFFTTKEVGKGTGLGLATVYGIVKQNSGFIEVDSEPDQGPTVKICLPRHIGKVERARMEGPQEPAMPGHETILIVEDEPALLELGSSMLAKLGYRVLAAATPGEAIRVAEAYPGEIHLLLTDVVMPEMNGRELAKKMLALYPGMGRLFMSGYTDDVIAHHGVLDEAVHFLQKPFSRTTLSAKVREALNGNGLPLRP